MKNKVLILALLVAFVSVSFMGCGGDSPKAIKAKDISVNEYSVTVTGYDKALEKGYMLTWEAKGKNVASYIVYIKKEDNATANDIGEATNLVTYNSGVNNYASASELSYISAYGVNTRAKPAQNTNPDKWTFVFDSANLCTGSVYNPGNGTTSYWDMNGSYYFGVRTVSFTNDYSNITWTKDPYTITVYDPTR
jgi:hypothetical protein